MATTFYLLVCTLIWTIFGVSLLLLTSPVAHSAEVRDNKGLHASQGRGLQDITHDQRWQYGDKSQKGLLQDNSDKSHITTKLGKGVRMIKKHKKVCIADKRTFQVYICLDVMIPWNLILNANAVYI